MKFTAPSEIQAKSFPLIMEEPRKCVIAQAKNGEGKTTAFGLGVLSSIDLSCSQIQAVIFEHTRELINQTTSVLQKIAKFTKIKIVGITSNQNVSYDDIELGQIIVITPGLFKNVFFNMSYSGIITVFGI